MPAYNVEQYVDGAIQSIINQTYSNWELLIADDCSSDTTQQIIDKYILADKRIKSFPNTENLGYLKTCNKLFGKSVGDLFTFQDADDYSLSSRFELQLKAFTENSTLGLCGTQVRFVDENSVELPRRGKKRIDYNDLLRFSSVENPFCGATIMVKKEVVDDIGFYRMFFDRIGGEDHDWANRILEKYTGVNLEESLYAYRQHSRSVSKKIDVRKVFTPKMIRIFTEQRVESGKDWLMTDESKAFDYLEKAVTEYSLDPSRVFRDYAASYMFNNLYNQAILTSWYAIKKGPFKMVNYRTLLYCLRKSIVK